jgi:hypothetical protein
VLYQSGRASPRGQLPELLESERVGLRRASCAERIAGDQLLGETATATLGNDRDRGTNLSARREARLRRAVAPPAHIAEYHTADGAVRVLERVADRKSGKHVDAGALGLRGQLCHQLPERDDKVAAIALLRRNR